MPLILALTSLRQTTGGATLAPDKVGSYVVYLALYTVVVLSAYLLHLPFEANTVRLRHWIKSVFTPGRVRAGA